MTDDTKSLDQQLAEIADDQSSLEVRVSDIEEMLNNYDEICDSVSNLSDDSDRHDSYLSVMQARVEALQAKVDTLSETVSWLVFTLQQVTEGKK